MKHVLHLYFRSGSAVCQQATKRQLPDIGYLSLTKSPGAGLLNRWWMVLEPNGSHITYSRLRKKALCTQEVFCGQQSKMIIIAFTYVCLFWASHLFYIQDYYKLKGKAYLSLSICLVMHEGLTTFVYVLCYGKTEAAFTHLLEVGSACWARRVGHRKRRAYASPFPHQQCSGAFRLGLKLEKSLINTGRTCSIHTQGCCWTQTHSFADLRKRAGHTQRSLCMTVPLLLQRRHNFLNLYATDSC